MAGRRLQRPVAERWKALTGNTILEGYGLSETSPVVSANPPGIKEFTGTIGYPFPSTEVSIRDAAGKPVPAGQPGEICVRGPQVMRGYWKPAEETARAMTADGFFRTGDVAVMEPDGQIKIVDRMKDMILVSGSTSTRTRSRRCWPPIPVLECAVVGARARRPRDGRAHVVMKDPEVSTDALRAHARTQLTGYKVCPAGWCCTTRCPRPMSARSCAGSCATRRPTVEAPRRIVVGRARNRPAPIAEG